MEKAKTENPCVLCGGRGVVDIGELFGCRTPGTYDPCPMCALRKQRDALLVALDRSEQTFRNLASDGSIVTMGTSLEIARNELENMRAAIAKARGE